MMQLANRIRSIRETDDCMTLNSMLPETKKCSKCEVLKQKIDFRVRTRKRKASVSTYLCSHCKQCEKLCLQITKKNNPQKYRDLKKAYRINNLEKVNQSKKAHRIKNIERYRELEKANYYEDVEKKRELKRLDYEKHREKRIAKKKIYQQNNPEIGIRSGRNWRKNHPDKVIEKAKYERSELIDSYVVGIIAKTSNLSLSEIREQPELIRLTKTIIQLKRKIKNER